MSDLTRRVTHGRGHSYYLDGNRVPGVTTAIGEGFPKPALINWAANVTIDYALDYWDELKELQPSVRRKRMAGARDEDRDVAARRGTEVHALAAAHALGKEILVPEELEGHVRSYERFVEEWAPVEQLVEVVCVNRRYRYMGTFDVIGTLGEETWLYDLKTTRSGVFSENALQLAGYRYAETYIGADGEEHPMPEIDRCGVLWLRSDGYDFIPVDVGRDEFKVFLYTLGIANWRGGIGKDVVGEALEPSRVAA